MESRRSFVLKLTMGSVAIGVFGGATIASPMRLDQASTPNQRSGPDITPEPLTPPPWHIVKPLGAGSELGHGWQLAELSGIVTGSTVATLRHVSGRTQEVQICRNDGSPEGIVHTATCDLVILNSGAGSRQTDEDLAQAVAELGRIIERNERNDEAAKTIASLATHREQLVRLSAARQGHLQ